MRKITQIFPADDFAIVAKNSADSVACGIVIGYDKSGNMCVFGGGLADGRRPTAKDWLWMIESFRQKLITGDYQ